MRQEEPEVRGPQPGSLEGTGRVRIDGMKGLGHPGLVGARHHGVTVSCVTRIEEERCQKD